jgi:hypothetical protein
MHNIPYKCEHIKTKVQNKAYDNNLCNECPRTEVPNALSFFVLTRVGLERTNPAYFPVLNAIMKLKAFQGIIGIYSN